MKKTGLILIILLICSVGWAQSITNKDSLLKLLTIAKEDTAKVQLYIDIGNRYELENLQTAGKYYQLAGNLSKRLGYKKGIIKYISNYTAILNEKGDFEKSLILNKQAFQIASGLNDKLYIAKTAANIGNNFNYLNESDSAIYYYETAGRYFEEIGNNYLLARMYEMEQLVYQNMGRYKKALQYGKMAVKELRASKDSIDLGRSLLNLANSYQSNDFPDSSLTYYKEALAISQKIKYGPGESASLLGIGNIYFHRFDADKMKPYYEKALALAKELDDPRGEAIATRGMALYYFLVKNFDKAKAFSVASVKLADSAATKYDKFESMQVLSSVLYAQHDIIAGEKVRDQMQLLENEIRGDELQQKTISIEKKFETEKKEAQIKLQKSQLRQKNTINYILIGSSIAFLIIALLVYRNYKHRQNLQQAKIDELETEKQLTATEAVLKGEEQERTRLAKDLHDGLGGMLSGIKFSLSTMKENLIMTPDNAHAFERSIDMLDTSIKEMRRVAHNMMPEVLVKYGLDTALKEFCTEIDRSGVVHINYQSVGMHEAEMEQTTSVTIYRIVQELLNNAIKHANAKNVLVQLHQSEQEQLLAVTVEDDGNGFDASLLKQSDGMGWLNIQNRVEFLKGRIDVQSGTGKGTSVMIEINI